MRELPVSDPAALVMLASRLRDDADALHEQTRRLDHRLDALRFEGPAALRLQASMAERKLRASAIAGELRSLAELSNHACQTG